MKTGIKNALVSCTWICKILETTGLKKEASDLNKLLVELSSLVYEADNIIADKLREKQFQNNITELIELAVDYRGLKSFIPKNTDLQEWILVWIEWLKHYYN